MCISVHVIVLQEPALFSCSIADNIRYGAADPQNVTMEMIEYAAKEAFADIFIKKFPHQYNTMVGERGMMLSGIVKLLKVFRC